MENGSWIKFEDCKSVKGQTIKTREELIGLVRDGGAEVADDAAIAVFIGDNELCYAVEDCNDFVFWSDGIFTPADRESVVMEVAETLAK